MTSPDFSHPTKPVGTMEAEQSSRVRGAQRITLAPGRGVFHLQAASGVSAVGKAALDAVFFVVPPRRDCRYADYWASSARPIHTCAAFGFPGGLIAAFSCARNSGEWYTWLLDTLCRVRARYGLISDAVFHAPTPRQHNRGNPSNPTR